MNKFRVENWRKFPSNKGTKAWNRLARGEEKWLERSWRAGESWGRGRSCPGQPGSPTQPPELLGMLLHHPTPGEPDLGVVDIGVPTRTHPSLGIPTLTGHFLPDTPLPAAPGSGTPCQAQGHSGAAFVSSFSCPRWERGMALRAELQA